MSFKIVLNRTNTVEKDIPTSGAAATAALKYIHNHQKVDVVRVKEGQKDKVVASWRDGNKIA